MSEPTRPNRVLLFEDDADVRVAVAQSLQLEGFDVEAFESADDALRHISADFDGVIVSDIRLPGADGRQVFRTVRTTDAEIPVVLITGHGELQEAVDLMREGVYDFISKPFPAARLHISVRNALEQRGLVLDNRRLRRGPQDGRTPLPLLGDSAHIASLRTTVRDLANTDVSVLICGETGTGKESVARALHDGGRRRGRAFAVLDCASLPDGILESELFGSESAAAGLTRHRPGRIEAADRGTLFLDRIDCLPFAAQGRLLRAVEDQQVTPIGATTPRSFSCRVISAATGDLAAMCAAATFRPDLYYRLNTVTLHLPPLRERRDDLATLFLELLARAAQRLKRPPPTLTRAAKAFLYDHGWPGNIRELSHYADRVVLGLEKAPGPQSDAARDPLPDLVERFEASLIKEALRATGGRVKDSLQILQIPRKTFYDKVARYRIDLDAFREGGNAVPLLARRTIRPE
jgi:two-component system C4-dicarboxylate transport response regulator DctD